MVKYLGHFLLGLLLTNWLYSELVLIVPEVEGISQQVSKVVKIPTHDEWPDIANSPRAVQLNQELNHSVAKLLPGRSQLFGSHITGLWKRRVSHRVARLFGSQTSAQEYSKHIYVRDSDMFVREALFVDFHDSKTSSGATVVRAF